MDNYTAAKIAHLEQCIKINLGSAQRARESRHDTLAVIVQKYADELQADLIALLQSIEETENPGE